MVPRPLVMHYGRAQIGEEERFRVVTDEYSESRGPIIGDLFEETCWAVCRFERGSAVALP
jgi:hypothetical protein